MKTFQLNTFTAPTGVVPSRAAWLLLAAGLGISLPSQAQLAIGPNPLYLVSGKANVLITLDNSNSMDEDASGAAVGSNSPLSKSEIARGVVRTLTDTYQNRINMGLMSYKQNSPSASNLHNSPYDASFDPATYDSSWTGARDSATKAYRIPNPSSAGKYVYYNVALPFYSGSNEGNAFCYSPTAKAFNNGESPSSGPWDTYRCFRVMSGTSNTLPTWGDGTSEAAKGYSSFIGQYTFSPTDSDFAQGILDFGKLMSWNYVGPTWLRNDSPGRGYLNVPLGLLTASQATSIKKNLACNVPGDPSPCTSTGIKNAGLTPIEGTLLTARDYFVGGWSDASEGYVAGCYPLPTSCGKDFVVLLTDGLPSTDKAGALVATPSTALAAAAAAAAALKAKGIETYIIGFALPYGTDKTSLDSIAIAGGTDKAYLADNPASLDAAFKTIFDDIFRKTSAYGSLSQNSTAINDGSRIYQGRFDSTDWSGELVAFNPKSDGTVETVWKSSDAGHFAAPASRKVFTLVPGTGGVAFKTLGDLSAAQQSALSTGSCGTGITDGADCGQARIDWIRGDQTKEASAGPLRKRSRILGDIISSSPFYAADTKTVFVGANDGMLHALSAATGDEIFAFVPNAVIANMYKLTSPSYAHDYFVDGEVTVSSKSMTPGKNILVGALGRGGRSVYALDVSNPGSFSASNVLWEFSDSDLGLVLGKLFVAKMNNGKTAVIFGNGFNSSSNKGALFILDIETGALIRKLETTVGSAGTPNGVTTPGGWDNDGNGTLDIAYFGDRLGNVWKFDVSASSPASWGPALGTTASPVPLFQAKDSLGNAQPITGGISVGINARKGDTNFGKQFLFFGTGQYLVSGDVTDKSVQTWYGLIDTGTAIPDRTVLKQRTITAEGTIAGKAVRAFSTATAGDMVGKRGWYIDLVPPSGANGERMTGDNKFFGSVLLATSIIPSADICKPGGESFLNAIDPFYGAALGSVFFDANGDSKFTSADTLTVGGKVVPVGSIDMKVNLSSDAILLGGSSGSSGGPDRLYVSGTSGDTASSGVKKLFPTGRIAWREIIRQN